MCDSVCDCVQKKQQKKAFKRDSFFGFCTKCRSVSIVSVYRSVCVCLCGASDFSPISVRWNYRAVALVFSTSHELFRLVVIGAKVVFFPSHLLLYSASFSLGSIRNPTSGQHGCRRRQPSSPQ